MLINLDPYLMRTQRQELQTLREKQIEEWRCRAAWLFSPSEFLGSGSEGELESRSSSSEMSDLVQMNP